MSDLKTIIPHECPHCQQPIYLEMDLPSPVLLGALTQEDINNAKKTAIERIHALGNLTAQARDEAIEWVNAEDTIFGPSYVNAIIEDLLTK